jgi:hypothetical protein
MSWCPDTAKVKKKMLYSSSFDALKKSLVGVQKYIQVCALHLFCMYAMIVDDFFEETLLSAYKCHSPEHH